MLLRISIFLGQYIIFCNQYYFINSLVGESVTSVPQGQYNFTVSIMIRNRFNAHPQRDHLCTAALISTRDVLTADHCVKDTNYDELQMSIGSNDLYRGTRFYPSWWLTYNRWAQVKNIRREFKTNDVAVIRLTESVERLNIIPVPLSTQRNQDYYGLEAKILGWGISNTGDTASILQSGNVRILTNDECEARVSRLEGRRIPFHERVFCSAADPYVLMHRGDSGGPLIFNNTIIAVNKGNLPLTGTIIHPEKVNFHFGIEFYRYFIQDFLRT